MNAVEILSDLRLHKHDLKVSLQTDDNPHISDVAITAMLDRITRDLTSGEKSSLVTRHGTAHTNFECVQEFGARLAELETKK
jgi:hypothetical protein